MEIRPSEISDILKKQIASFDAGAELSETGQVVSVGDGIATIYGLGKRTGRRNGGIPGRFARHGAEPCGG